MKSMTCTQLGGPCTQVLQGATADDVIKAQDKHLRDMVAGGDDTHAAALASMKGRWKNPIAGMGWYRQTKRAFAALPADRRDAASWEGAEAFSGRGRARSPRRAT